MNDFLNLKYINKLKEVYRFAHVGDRHESSAEHSWSALLIADYLITTFTPVVDRLRVYELLMYHDLIEIEVGDAPLDPAVDRSDRHVQKLQGALMLKEKLPASIREKFIELFSEFESPASLEGRFARVCDALDADIHELDYRTDWKGWTKEFYTAHRAHLFTDFPELAFIYNELLAYLEANGYIV